MMSIFSENGIIYTIITIGIVFAVNLFGTQLKEAISPESEENELEASETKMHQGFLENSNVTSVEEMTEMISTVRMFETYQKMIQSIDSMDDQSVNTIGRVG